MRLRRRTWLERSKRIKISVINHAETGNTEKMAELIEKGCQNVAGIEAKRCVGAPPVTIAALELRGLAQFNQ